MSVNPVSEEELRAALACHRVDPVAFEAGVVTRLKVMSGERANDPLAGLSPFWKSVAALLPLSVLTGCKVAPAPVQLSPTAIGSKLLSYLAFPAVSFFALLAATLFSVSKIRNLQPQSGDIPSTEALQRWNSDHKWGALAVFIVSLALAYFGSSELLFWFYICSFGILLNVVTAFAKIGLGNRYVVGAMCMQGLMFLGQASMFAGIGDREIHLLDPSLVTVVFIGGSLAVLVAFVCCSAPPAGMPFKGKGYQRVVGFLFAIIVVPLLASLLRPVLWGPTPTRIKHFIESFDHARFSSSSWHEWEVPARWAIDSHLDPDLSQPRQLVQNEIRGEQNRYVLSSAMRCGLLSVDQLPLLKEYDSMRGSLLTESPGMKPFRVTSLSQYDWVVRAAVMQDDLTPKEKVLLEQRLHATLQDLPNYTYVTLDDLLRATQLLELIGRPVNPGQYREKIHHLLRQLHSKGGGGFQVAGGFKGSLSLPEDFPGDMIVTSQAVQLMEIYGVPADLDLHWVRSFLRPRSRGSKPLEMVAAVTLDRLNHLLRVQQPTWLEYLYYERTLLAAVVLVGLCLYATLVSPNPKAAVSEVKPLAN